MRKFINRILCLFIGHHKTQKYVETEYYFYSHKCKRCGSPLGPPVRWKGVINHPPPNSTNEELILWREHCEKKNQEYRDLCND